MDTLLPHADCKKRDVPLLPVLGCIVAAVMLTAAAMIVANYVFDAMGMLR